MGVKMYIRLSVSFLTLALGRMMVMFISYKVANNSKEHNYFI